MGVVYDPFKNELFCAEKGKGALMNDKKIRVAKSYSVLNLPYLVLGFLIENKTTLVFT